MAEQPFRTAGGNQIKREQPLSFRFNGKNYEGYHGDTLASGLLANGVHLVGRSFKYHRPRGIMASGSEDPQSMVQLGVGAHTVPNLKATEIELYDGLQAASVNSWPSLNFDLLSINNIVSGLLPAGFYYKTFFRSLKLWQYLFEPLIRRGSGWGKAPSHADPDVYDHKHVHCDVLVVGGGPAGLMAALSAGRAGARIILADEKPRFGGALRSLRRQIDGRPNELWIDDRIDELSELSDVLLLTRTTVFGYYDQNYLVALERRLDHSGQPSSVANPRERVHHIRAKQVILATGAHERPIVFANNDRPGILLAGAAQAYCNGYGVLPGKKGILFTNNDGAYEAALDLTNQGVEIGAIVDVRSNSRGDLPIRAMDRGMQVYWGHAVISAQGTKRVNGVALAKLDGDQISGPVTILSCDHLLVSGGWSPVVHLYCQARGKLKFDEQVVGFVPDHCPQSVQVAGSAGGKYSLKACLEAGVESGQQATKALDLPLNSPISVPDVEEGAVSPPEAIWTVPSDRSPGSKNGKKFVDFQNDTTAADIALATREGFESVEHMKRYTLSGFGTDQGKTGNINALAILSNFLGQSIPETGTTTFRPPYTPVTFGALAGRFVGQNLDPVRKTSIHSWHEKYGAEFEDVGQWKRPWYFARSGEDMAAAIARECSAARNDAALLDASTLGKIMIQGPDALTFLNRIYTNNWNTLKIGHSRYGLMCGEDGMVFDDGTTSRLSDDTFLMTTTTGGAERVLNWLEDYLQTEWTDLRVYLTTVTEQWSTVTISGPKSRQVIEAAGTTINLDPRAFKFMTIKEGYVCDIPARLFRISFTCELSYEINVPWDFGLQLWERLFDAGQEFGITPYGTETMHVLRAEKGFIIVGQDTDGTVTPHDLGMKWIVSDKKGDFIGKRSFSRVDTARSDRKQLVGILTYQPNEIIPEGAQLVSDPKPPIPVQSLGHVTSSYWSASLGKSIALGLVKNGRDLIGQTVYAPVESKTIRAQITEPVFLDPDNLRRDGLQ